MLRRMAGIITAVQQQQDKTTHEPDKKLHQNLHAYDSSKTDSDMHKFA
jgi:hypothetical protein